MLKCPAIGGKKPRWLMTDKFRKVDSAHHAPNSFAASSVEHTILGPRLEYERTVPKWDRRAAETKSVKLFERSHQASSIILPLVASNRTASRRV